MNGIVLRIILWLVFIFGGMGVSIYLDSTIFSAYHLDKVLHVISFVFGVMIFVIVVIISRNTGKTLATFGREGDVPKMETNKLVRVGPYSCMRHPMHFGLMFFPLSIALIIGSFSFIFVVAPIEIVVMIVLIAIFEEKELQRKFGREYVEYKKGTSFFSIRLSCLKLLFKSTHEN